MIQKLDSEVMQSLDVDVKDYGLRNCKNYPRTRRLVLTLMGILESQENFCLKRTAKINIFQN